MKYKDKKLKSYLDIRQIKVNEDTLSYLRNRCTEYTGHRFNLLGSGTVRVEYGMEANGIQGKRYRNRTRKIDSLRKFSLLKYLSPFSFLPYLLLRKEVDKEYVPIDWHIDFKSGYRYDAYRYYSPAKCLKSIGDAEKAEIKVPWELGRFYHFPQMAVVAVFDKDKRESLLREYKNQIYDFIISNPYAKCIQWSSAMDVSIRIVNILIAFDIFSQIDTASILDFRFRRRLLGFTAQHGRFIYRHLEYGKIPSNHYPADLVGLLYAGSYLPKSRITRNWIEFSIKEIVDCVKRQYHEEGTHFEGSTFYHCLTTEFIMFATAMIQRLKKPDWLPDWYLNRLWLAGRFIQDITKQNGELLQVGDNDSGRLLKLSSNDAMGREMMCAYEEALFTHMTGEYKVKYPLEYSLVKCLAKSSIHLDDRLKEEKEYDFSLVQNTELPYSAEKVFQGKNPESSYLKGLMHKYYKEFGIYIMRSERMFVSIVVDTSRYAKLYGHIHNDKLSVELTLDGENILTDPGSYLYTSDSNTRNVFRCTRAHNTVWCGVEQNLFMGTFGLRKQSVGRVISASYNAVRCQAEYRGIIHQREVCVEDGAVIIKDWCNKKFQCNYTGQPYSRGYGELVRRVREDDNQ